MHSCLVDRSTAQPQSDGTQILGVVRRGQTTPTQSCTIRQKQSTGKMRGLLHTKCCFEQPARACWKTRHMGYLETLPGPNQFKKAALNRLHRFGCSPPLTGRGGGRGGAPSDPNMLTCFFGGTSLSHAFLVYLVAGQQKRAPQPSSRN